MRFFVSAIFVMMVSSISANTWNIEVGGTTSQTPYYSPQHLVIQVGDIVKWTFVSGLHNVTSSSGPEAFASGDRIGNSNGSVSYSKTFTLPGMYNFNCTFEGHSQTQFGSIRVEGTVGMEEMASMSDIDFSIRPNPASDFVIIEKNASYNSDIKIFDLMGRTIVLENSTTDVQKQYDTNSFTKGIYFVEIRTENRVIRKRLIVK